MPTDKHKSSRFWIVLLIAAALVVAIGALIQLEQSNRAGSGLGQGYRYDISSLANIDPNLIQYESLGPALVTGLSQAYDIDVDRQGKIYVAGEYGVVILDANGGAVSTPSRDRGPRERMVTGRCRAVSVAPNGTIYVGRSDHVEVYDPNGQQTARWDPLGDKALITSVAVTEKTVYVADAGRRQVLLYDPNGMLKGSVSQDEENHFDGFIVPSPYFDLAMGRDGLLRVVNPGRLRVDTFTAAGGYEFSWGQASNGIKGFCGCCNPAGLAILPDGRFITAEKGLMRVKVYNSDGGFVGVVAGPEQLEVNMQPKVCETPEECQADGLDVAVDSEGRIYVLDTRQATIHVFGRKGDTR